MPKIIKEFSFNVNFKKDKFERANNSTESIVLVENDNKTTKLIFNFKEPIEDGTTILIRIGHSDGFTKDYMLYAEEQKVELILNSGIAIKGVLTISISLIGNNDEVLTISQFQKILVKESITGDEPIPEEEVNTITTLISQVNTLKVETTTAKNEIEKSFGEIQETYNEDLKEIQKIIENNEEMKAKVNELEEIIGNLATILDNVNGEVV